MSKSALTINPDGSAYSYQTCLVQVLDNGETIANKTYYSVTTSKHYGKTNANYADHEAFDVPTGTTDLRPFIVTKEEQAAKAEAEAVAKAERTKENRKAGAKKAAATRAKNKTVPQHINEAVKVLS
jgi:hypothetical protein